jgi:hypothetical protein
MDKEQVGLQEAPHLRDSQNNSENSKSRSSKEDFFFIKQPLVLFRRIFKSSL